MTDIVVRSHVTPDCILLRGYSNFLHSLSHAHCIIFEQSYINHTVTWECYCEGKIIIGWFFFCPNKLNKTHSLFSWLNKLNSQTDLKRTTQLILCLYVADPATFQASNSVLGPNFPLNSLFIHLWTKYIFLTWSHNFNNIVHIEILNLNFFSKTTQRPFNTNLHQIVICFVYFERVNRLFSTS